MIQAKDLRLNNYINHKDLGIVKVISISSKIGDYESVFVESLKDGFDYNFHLDEDLKPIPLTEEILLKIGFVQIGFYENVFSKGSSRIHLHNEGKKALLIYQYENNHIELEIESLHDLQNKFFAIGGKELEVKL